VEQRVGHPLLPLRVVADRSRGMAFAAVGIAGLVLGLLRQRTESVLPGMGVHMSLNAIALAIALLVS